MRRDVRQSARDTRQDERQESLGDGAIVSVMSGILPRGSLRAAAAIWIETTASGCELRFVRGSVRRFAMRDLNRGSPRETHAAMRVTWLRKGAKGAREIRRDVRQYAATPARTSGESRWAMSAIVSVTRGSLRTAAAI